MERTGTVIIARTECVILGGSANALEQALALAKQKKVLMIVGGIRLAEDICDTNRYQRPDVELPFQRELLPGDGDETPDQYQKRLEDLCEKSGIEVLYFLRYVDSRPVGEETLVRVAGKGGVFGILCGSCVDCREVQTEERYLAMITREGQSGYELLEAADGGGARCDHAHRLLSLKRALLEKLIQRRAQDPKLHPGRFAVRGFGKAVSERDRERDLERRSVRDAADDLDWRGRKPAEKMERFAVKGQNRFGRFTFLEQSAEEAAVEAATETWDLVVAGGGTAGVMAALHAGRNGLRTVLIEPNYDLGGTQTVGGVSTYWFGHRFSDVREIDGEVERLCAACGVRKKQGIWSEADDFHAGIRSYVYLKLCLEAGVKIVFGQLAHSAVCCEDAAGRRIQGVVTAGDAGNRVYFGKAVIDATGDGDLAVAAGAAGCYGSERDLITYWGSLAQYTSPETYKNNFSSMLFAEDPLDYSRFIRLGRKRGGEIFDHGSYVSMRESRHIRGESTVTLRDLITYRTYPDGLYTCYSNYDPKGKLDADMVYCGVLPPQVSIQIPLSALLPVDEAGRRIQGLYVAGKAISATHNVFPSIRMQPDLMHQGAVLGALLAKALLSGKTPETMGEQERRRFLLSYTDDSLTLPEFTKSGAECASQITDRDRTHWVDVEFSFEETGCFPSLGLMAAAETDEREAVRRILRKRLATEKDPELRQTLIGYALWYGMDDWTEELCAILCRKLAAPGADADCAEDGESDGKCVLPERSGSVMCAQLLPDHGVMPEVVYQLNQLGFSRKKVILEPFELLLGLLERTRRDYLRIQKGTYHYIEAFVYAAEHSGQKEFIPMLKRLLRLPELRDCVDAAEQNDGIKRKDETCQYDQEKGERGILHESRSAEASEGPQHDRDAVENGELMRERLQILVFLLNRTLAMLGAPEGFTGLADLLLIENMAIRGSAVMTLRRLTGEDRGVSREGWLSVFAQGVLQPVTQTARTDKTSGADKNKIW